MSISQQEITSLFRHESARLQRFLTRKLGCVEDAEDVAQDTYLRMIGSRVEASQVRCPQAFLFAVASNKAVDLLRRRQCERNAALRLPGPDSVRSGDEYEIVCPRRMPEDEVDSIQRLHHVLGCLAGVSQKERAAFIMHKFMDMSYMQVAEQLGVTVSMIEKYLSQTLRHVRGLAAD